MKAPSRTLTTLAVGFLALDAILLGYLGLALKRLLLLGAVPNSPFIVLPARRQPVR